MTCLSSLDGGLLCFLIRQGKEAEEYLKQGTMVPASMIIGEPM
jgi:hypothetical protein